MIRRLTTLVQRWRSRRAQAATHHATVDGVELRHRTAKSLGLCGNQERHDAIELTDAERQQVADMERRWNGGQR